MNMIRNMAVLVANGFDESDFIAAQKVMREMGIEMKIISANQGLVNGWNGSGWGHNFAVDVQVNAALGADYDALLIPAGSRSHDKLSTTAHTKRIIGSMMDANKPVIAMGDAVGLMAQCEMLAGHTVTGPSMMKDMVMQSGAQWEEDAYMIHGSMMTGMWSDEFAEAMKMFLMNSDDIKEAA